MGCLTPARVGQAQPGNTEPVSKILPEPIAQKVNDFPEWRMGTQRIKVTLVDGRTFYPVDVAWGREIVRVVGYEEVPFEAEDVVEVEHLSDG